MKNTFGQSVAVTLFGESHGAEIGVVIDGITPGIRVKEEDIAAALDRRRPSGRISTARAETDKFRIVSGVMNGRTTGTPICILIPNTDTRSKDYSRMASLPRPGHADFSAECKYHGFQDFRGGGHFSGRLTAPLVAAGAIACSALAEKGITIGTHIAELGGVKDRKFDVYAQDFALIRGSNFPVLDETAAQEMRKAAEKAACEGDSVGGVLETAICGVPCGVGEPWFDTLEGVLAHAMYSIPAVKGVEFGDGFALSAMRGSVSNDAYIMEDGHVRTATNHAGGICGGITTGMPITFRLAVKPTPSIRKPQRTVNLSTMKGEELTVEGRHDPTVVHRAAPVADALSALVILDLLSSRFGTDWFLPA
ncbi:MAG: chorismate synthase [Eubacteriales bacterium]